MTDNYDEVLATIRTEYGEPMTSIVHAVIQSRGTIALVSREIRKNPVPVETVREAVVEMVSLTVSILCDVAHLDFETQVKPIVEQTVERLNTRVMQ